MEYGFIIQSGSWFSVVNPSTGEVLADDEGNPMKYQGLPKVLANLKENEDLVNELDEMLKEEYLKED